MVSFLLSFQMAANNVDIDEMGMGADMEALRANLAKLRKAGVKVIKGHISS